MHMCVMSAAGSSGWGSGLCVRMRVCVYVCVYILFVMLLALF